MLAATTTTDTDQPERDVARVVLAEDHELFADALSRTLEASQRFDILDCVTSGDDLVRSWRYHQPDLVITDLSMRPVGGVEATKAITSLDPDARVVIVSAFEEQYLIKDAVAAGAIGFISKCAPSGQLLHHLIEAAEGRPAFDATSTTALTAMTRGRVPTLSPRQIEVLTLRSRGNTLAEIAEALYISLSTVKHHTREALQALGVTGVNQAIRRAIELGIIRLDDD